VDAVARRARLAQLAADVQTMLLFKKIKIRDINVRAILIVRTVNELTAREKRHLLNEILQVRGLMPLLMKPRNKQPWSEDDKAELAVHLRRLSQISPYLLILVMPGGFFILPALAWWLDRRRNRVSPPPTPA
jgi:hypothetical protein